MCSRLFLVVVLFAIQASATTEVYGAVNSGFMLHEGQEKFVSLDKFGGGIGISSELFSFLSVGAEFSYLRGSTNDPIPHALKGERVPEAYGGFSYRGLNFVKVTYYELWLRPKLILPIPLLKPYLVVPVSPLSMGGMRGYSVYGVGLGALMGLGLSLGPFGAFAESGLMMRARKGAAHNGDGPPWAMFDGTVSLNAGVSIAF